MNRIKTSYLILGLCCLCFSSVFIFTREAFYNAFVLENKGQIGDTIGGITAPIINICGAILVFISFRAQNVANALQAEQNSFVFLHALLNDVKRDYENLTFIYKAESGSKSVHGRRALMSFLQLASKRISLPNFKNNSFFHEFLFLIGSISILVDQVEKARISEENRLTLLQLLHFFFETRLKKESKAITVFFENQENLDDFFLSFNKTVKDFHDKMEANYQKNFKSNSAA